MVYPGGTKTIWSTETLASSNGATVSASSPVTATNNGSVKITVDYSYYLKTGAGTNPFVSINVSSSGYISVTCGSNSYTHFSFGANGVNFDLGDKSTFLTLYKGAIELGVGNNNIRMDSGHFYLEFRNGGSNYRIDLCNLTASGNIWQLPVKSI
jgi:hypothetical protein